jgi:hypothetical protein
MDDLLDARGEAVKEITTSMLKAAGESMLRHGNDPHSEIILAAAIAMFIDKVQPLCGDGFK